MSNPSVSKLAPLTSLRFFAAAMIVIGHSHHLLGSLGIATTFSLSQGVSFFFVLSGFILSYNYESLPNRKAAARFLVSRLARIWPLHIATLLIWLAIITPQITHEFSAPISATAKLMLNALLLQSWSFTAPVILSFNGVAWSISTEAFFYATFAVIALSPTRRLPLALILSSLCAVAFITASTRAGLSAEDGTPGLTMFSVLYTNPLVRLFEFLFGVVCARLYRAHGYKTAKDPLKNTSRFGKMPDHYRRAA
ncbi:acyltransferase family protein [Pseudomonas sp. NMI795_08]|uniref:acyltransferase family protein n=1 Tax=Pseudomonas sp. NMI795_08 TaxID=2903144 RepID=UPI001E2AD384|nr:acyltransferase [Pseudomonas sp. NMI795_08]MCE1119147.1 acyltransferase [Pseudomonas sp. NMI795_08]